jgi:hypothetical protein
MRTESDPITDGYDVLTVVDCACVDALAALAASASGSSGPFGSSRSFASFGPLGPLECFSRSAASDGDVVVPIVDPEPDAIEGVVLVRVPVPVSVLVEECTS